MNYILNFQFNSLLGIVLYWFPLLLCLYGYSIRTWNNYQKDKIKRVKDPEWYRPTDKVGTILGRVIITGCPVANLLATVFDLAPEILGRFFWRLEKLFNFPLVPPLKK